MSHLVLCIDGGASGREGERESERARARETERERERDVY